MFESALTLTAIVHSPIFQIIVAGILVGTLIKVLMTEVIKKLFSALWSGIQWAWGKFVENYEYIRDLFILFILTTLILSSLAFLAMKLGLGSGLYLFLAKIKFLGSLMFLQLAFFSLVTYCILCKITQDSVEDTPLFAKIYTHIHSVLFLLCWIALNAQLLSPWTGLRLFAASAVHILAAVLAALMGIALITTFFRDEDDNPLLMILKPYADLITAPIIGMGLDLGNSPESISVPKPLELIAMLASSLTACIGLSYLMFPHSIYPWLANNQFLGALWLGKACLFIFCAMSLMHYFKDMAEKNDGFSVHQTLNGLAALSLLLPLLSNLLFITSFHSFGSQYLTLLPAILGSLLLVGLIEMAIHTNAMEDDEIPILGILTPAKNFLFSSHRALQEIDSDTNVFTRR
jgi:hypothetical protein